MYSTEQLRIALAEQFLLQYGTEPKDLDSCVAKLLKMREDRVALDLALLGYIEPDDSRDEGEV